MYFEELYKPNQNSNFQDVSIQKYGFSHYAIALYKTHCMKYLAEHICPDQKKNVFRDHNHLRNKNCKYSHYKIKLNCENTFEFMFISQDHFCKMHRFSQRLKRFVEFAQKMQKESGSCSFSKSFALVVFWNLTNSIKNAKKKEENSYQE